MLNLNKNKLIPATEISTSWGEIKGDISKQTDLVKLTTDLDTSIKGWVESKGYVTAETLPEGIATQEWVTNQGYITSIPDTFATKDWVSTQGYLTEHQDLSSYALKTEIPSLDGYATENWVTSQGYLTEHQDLSSYALKTEIPSLDGYATENWVTSQGYLTQHQDLKTINNESIVGSGNIEIKALTKVQEEALDVITNPSEGVLTYDLPLLDTGVYFKTSPFTPNNTTGSRNVFNINGDIFGVQYENTSIFNLYKFVNDYENFGFLSWATVITSEEMFNTQMPLWTDNSGRVRYGTIGTIDIIGKDNVTFSSWDIGVDQNGDSAANYYNAYLGSTHNIIKTQNHIYLIAPANNIAFIYNEETGQFDHSIPYINNANVTGNNFYRWAGFFGDHYVSKSYDVWIELVEHFENGEVVSLSFDGMEKDKYFPETINVGYNTINITAQAIKNIKPENGTSYVVWWDTTAGNTLYKFVDGNWEPVEGFKFEDTLKGAAQGAISGELMFGFGYNNSYRGTVPVWNLGSPIGGGINWSNYLSDIVDVLNQRISENYTKLDKRLSTVESTLGDASTITNEILS